MTQTVRSISLRLLPPARWIRAFRFAARRWATGDRARDLHADTDGVTTGIVLVLDSFVPTCLDDGGVTRLKAIVAGLQRDGRHVVFVPFDGIRRKEPSLTCEIRYPRSIRQLVRKLPAGSVIWACRPDCTSQRLFRFATRCGVRTVYDTVDLHWQRLHSQKEALGEQRFDRLFVAAVRHMETRLLEAAQVSVFASENDMKAGKVRTSVGHVLPVSFNIRSVVNRSSNSSCFYFVGAVRHPPNVAAAQFLVRQVFPSLIRRLPQVRLSLVGQGWSDLFEAHDWLDFCGYVASLEPIADKHVAMLAPLTFGAGTNGKIVEAMALGCPVVSTEFALRSLRIDTSTETVPAIIANSETEFVEACVQLHSDLALQNSCATAGLAFAKQFGPDRLDAVLGEILVSHLTAPNDRN
jgi:O-antigen biosynthesis protein